MLRIEEYVADIIQEQISLSDATFFEIGKQLQEFRVSMVQVAKEFIRNDSTISSRESRQMVNNIEEISEGCGALLDVAVKGFSNINAAYIKDKKQNEILVLKQDIARAKQNEVEKFALISKKNTSKLKELLKKFGNVVYEYEDVENAEKYKYIKNGLLMQLRTYRTSYYCQLTLDFIRSEYSAWLSGKHHSELMEPTYLMVNSNILDEVFYPLTREEIYNNITESSQLTEELNLILNKEKPSFNGRVLSILIDEQLLAYFLSNRENIYVLHEIVTEKTLVGKLLKDNSVFNEIETEAKTLHDTEEKGDGTTFTHILYIVMLMLNAYVFNHLLKDTVSQKVAFIVGGLVMLIIIRKWYRKIKLKKQKFKELIEHIYEVNRLEIRKKAGYKEQIERVEPVSFWNKAIVGIAIGAIIGLFVPIPGGMLIGAAIGFFIAFSANE